MTRSRRHRSQQHPPQAQTIGPTQLSDTSATTVLLGLIASEAIRRCAEEKVRVEAMLAERLAFHEEHCPEDSELWVRRQRLWRPVSALFEFLPTSVGALTAAPLLSISARPDGGDEQCIRFSVCERGLIRVSTQKWPAMAPAPTFPPTPRTFTDAITTAQQVVAQAIPSLLALADPLRIK